MASLGRYEYFLPCRPVALGENQPFPSFAALSPYDKNCCLLDRNCLVSKYQYWYIRQSQLCSGLLNSQFHFINVSWKIKRSCSYFSAVFLKKLVHECKTVTNVSSLSSVSIYFGMGVCDLRNFVVSNSASDYLLSVLITSVISSVFTLCLSVVPTG